MIYDWPKYCSSQRPVYSLAFNKNGIMAELMENSSANKTILLMLLFELSFVSTEQNNHHSANRSTEMLPAAQISQI